MNSRPKSERDRVRRGFTLIELLTVVAIIALLISILLPSLSAARAQAKAAASRAIQKSAGDGLDMFRNENPGEVNGEGYPDSKNRDDPTIEGKQYIFGSQWLVRYLMGKNLDGYVPKKNVPRQLIAEQAGDPNTWAQKGWYSTGAGDPEQPSAWAPLEKSGPYLTPDNVEIKRPDELQGAANVTMMGNITADSLKQPVLLDKFGYPILYYSANTRLLKASTTTPPIGYTGCVDTVCYGQPGVYQLSDNGLFTGACDGNETNPGTCIYNAWDFAGAGVEHKIKYFGDYNAGTPSSIADDPADLHTFAYYILNHEIYDSTVDDTDLNKVTLVPVKQDSFIMISPGRDGVFGTKDDVTNFN